MNGECVAWSSSSLRVVASSKEDSGEDGAPRIIVVGGGTSHRGHKTKSKVSKPHCRPSAPEENAAQGAKGGLRRGGEGRETRQPENSKRAHVRPPALQDTTKIPPKDPRERKITKMGAGEREKSANFWALSPLPPFGAPHFGAATFRCPTWVRGFTFGGSTFSGFGAPHFGAPSSMFFFVRVCHFLSCPNVVLVPFVFFLSRRPFCLICPVSGFFFVPWAFFFRPNTA